MKILTQKNEEDFWKNLVYPIKNYRVNCIYLAFCITISYLLIYIFRHYTMKKTFLIFFWVFILLAWVFTVFANTASHITTIQGASENERWYIGNIIADMFVPAGINIKNAFLAPFRNIYTDTSITNTIPRWVNDGIGEARFEPGSLYDTGFGIWVNRVPHSSYALTASGGIFSLNWPVRFQSDDDIIVSSWSGVVLRTANMNRLYLNHVGDIGIGTLTPTEKLHVVWDIRTTWNVYGQAFMYSSDRRLKEDIQELDRTLISQLDWKRFTWSDTGRQTYWFIAQEVESIIPEIVLTDDRWYKSVEYAALLPFLVEELKAQQNELIELREKVLDLQEAVYILSRTSSSN